ncbi:hypothetical protein [Leifsonia sp. Root4]|uniref:hypothetical protein n=1 Tax=Leifsonia sp. Root4 TaxID=1736525 RepID=UPI0012F79202|nr:hypothetical protein [Leifsonia sp. Root4]
MSTPRDSVRRQMPRPARQVAPHLESYVSSQTGEPIHVGCVCPIGRPHSYEEWQSSTTLRPGAQRLRRAGNDAT